MDMLRGMRVFVAVAEEGHFGDAARRLDLSQPTISQALRRLERDLGVTLVDRTPRGALLTDAGRRLLPRARLLIGDADLFVADARREGDAPDTVRWGLDQTCTATMAAACAARLANRVVDQSPAVGATARLVEQVVDGTLDVAVVQKPALLSGLSAGAAVRFERAVIVPTAYARARLARLNGLDLIVPPRASNPPGFDELLDEFRAAGVDPTPVSTTSPIAAAARIAAGTAFTVTANPTEFDAAPGVAVLPTAADRFRLRLHVVHRDADHRETAQEFTSALWSLTKDTR